MENWISQICGNCHFSPTAHRAQKYTDPKTLQWAIQLATRPTALAAQWVGPLQTFSSWEWLCHSHLNFHILETSSSQLLHWVAATTTFVWDTLGATVKVKESLWSEQGRDSELLEAPFSTHVKRYRDFHLSLLQTN